MPFVSIQPCSLPWNGLQPDSCVGVAPLHQDIISHLMVDAVAVDKTGYQSVRWSLGAAPRDAQRNGPNATWFLWMVRNGG